MNHLEARTGRSGHQTYSLSRAMKADYRGSDFGDIAGALNVCLAQLIDLRLRVKQVHWNAKGGSFYALHKMLDDFASELDALADEIAERVMAIGGVASGSAHAIAACSKLAREWGHSLRADDVLSALSGDYETTRAEVRRTFERLAAAEDEASIDIIVGTMKLLDKHRAFLKAHIAT
jgi:starvation-inducible DNA-binding protein